MDKIKKYDPERKWLIEVNEEQLRTIMDCVEDCHCFVAGHTELEHCTALLDNCNDVRQQLGGLHPLVTPGIGPTYYGWNGDNCPNMAQRKFIAHTYAIYMSLRHLYWMFLDNDDSNHSYSVLGYNAFLEEASACGEPLAGLELNEKKSRIATTT